VSEHPWLRLYPDGEPSGLGAPGRTVLESFEDWARARPRDVFIRYFDDDITIAEAARLVDEYSRILWALGLRRGDRVGLLMQNVPQFVFSMIAAWRCGAVAVPLSPLLRANELEKLLRDSGCVMVVTQDSYVQTLTNASVGTTVRDVVITSATEYGKPESFPAVVREESRPELSSLPALRAQYGNARQPPRAAVDGQDPAMLVYTSGTTGAPKGAVVTHGNVTFVSEAYRRWVRLGADDIVLASAPLFHITGLIGHICISIRARCQLLLAYRFDAPRYAELIASTKATFTVAATTVYTAFLTSEGAARYNLSSLHKAFTGGAPIPPAIIGEYERRTGVYIRNLYGLTETTGPSHGVPADRRAPVDAESNAVSIGTPIYDTAAWVRGLNGERLAPGEIGELVITGPQVVDGYWNRPDETAQSFTPDGFCTGDLGFVDDDGWFYVVDRKKDVIIASGFKVWPREVEDALYTHPGVREAIVIGVPDRYRGETVRAYVSLRADASVESADLVAFCRERVASYKYPREVVIMEDLPKTATGKLSREALRQHDREIEVPAAGVEVGHA
jgi:long-chain acyl-CoA synthetase